MKSLQVYPPAVGRARRRRWPAGLGQQMARGSLVAHLRSIGGAGGVGAASGDGRRRGSDGTAAAAQSLAQCRRG
jgi:hypothetical protein